MSESSNESQDESPEYTKQKKLKRTTKSMKLQISDEETKYRNKKFKNVDVISDCAEKLQCTKCSTSVKSVVLEGRDVYTHPLLKVIMCKKCTDFYGSGEFSLDEDDEDKYCRWCGEGGTLFLCSKCICGFCPKCIKKHFGNEKKKEIENDDDWICFFCKPDWLYELRAICSLALEASSKNRKEIRARRESKLNSMTKKASTGNSRGRPKRSLRGSSPNSSSEKGTNSEPSEIQILSSTEEDEKEEVKEKEKPKKKGDLKKEKDKEKEDLKKEKEKEKEIEKEKEESEKEKETSAKNKTPKIALKRKRGSKVNVTPKVNGRASGVDTSSEASGAEAKSLKKRKTTPKEPPKKQPVAAAKQSDEAPKKKKVESDVSSSETEEEEPETSISIPTKQVSKSLGKLTDLFKLTEMTAQLCLDVCKKHLKKLQNKNTVVTNEKLIKESEKLKTVVTMLSTNLNTVSSTVSSLQSKLGVDAKIIDVANLFSTDCSDDSVRGLFTLLLRGIEANQSKIAGTSLAEQPVKSEPVKTTPTKTTPAKSTPVKTTPIKESPEKKEPEPETSEEKPETMEVDDTEEPDKKEEEKMAVDEEEKMTVDEEEKVQEERDEPEEIPKETEEEENKEPEESDNGKETPDLQIDEKESEGNSDKVESAGSNNEDMFSALEAIFTEGGEDKKDKEEPIVNGGSDKSPKKTEGISLKILTQVEKSGVSDLESASTSKGIEGTVAD